MPDAARALAYSDVGLEMSGDGRADHAPDQGVLHNGGSAADARRYLLPPLVLARLIQGGRVVGRDRVLDVAAGGGYSTAVLAGLAGEVVALEDSAAMCHGLEQRLAAVGLARVRVVERALDQGVAEAGPFDVIVVNGTVEVGFDELLRQLAEGGRMVAIRRDPADPSGRAAKAMAWETRNGKIGTRYLFDASAPVLPAFKRQAAFSF